jgi:hypothetical protein
MRKTRVRSAYPWWMLLAASIYILTLCVNAWVEAFGPADVGLRYSVRDSHGVRPSFEIESVVPDSPLERTGAQAGDVIRTADGRAIAGQTDWFLARSHFEIDRPIQLEVRRGQEDLRLSVTVSERNWRTWDSGVVAFQIARVAVLLVAIIVVLRRPADASAHLVGLLFAMVAVAEAFPPAGWAAALRHLPPLLGIPIALASVSWLLMPVPWLVLAMMFPRPRSLRPWMWALILAPVVVLAPLILMSTVAVVYEPAGLAMPVPFLDVARTRELQSVWGVIPTLFVNLWPLYQPEFHAYLLQFWAGVSLSWWIAGSVAIVLTARRVTGEDERRLMRRLVIALVAALGIGIHNVFVRNWGYWFGFSPPVVFSTVSLVAEAVAFTFLAGTLVYSVIRRPG